MNAKNLELSGGTQLVMSVKWRREELEAALARYNKAASLVGQVTIKLEETKND